ncbi:unnamed protein product [Blepharisma stoltei]|uniref:Uncharacterized protein n=1 Tax=Blepharisma stoltei TaxID=1481888 RepID=A0AAU9IK12_9CILI|nr:unnamed protein product [Blepharisma stoltei]
MLFIFCFGAIIRLSSYAYLIKLLFKHFYSFFIHKKLIETDTTLEIHKFIETCSYIPWLLLAPKVFYLTYILSGEKMKIALLVLLISLAYAEWELDLGVSMTCPLYSCKPDTVPFGDSSVCLQVFGSNYYTRKCSSGYTCDISGVNNGRAYCIYDNGNTPELRYNGEVCTYDSDCMSSSCVDNVCKRSQEGDVCASDTDCNAGQFCFYNKTSTENYCVPQLKSGQTGCTNDNQCESTCGCRIMSIASSTKNTCTPYFSLPNYTPIMGCPSTGLTKLICTSGYCWGNTTTSMCIPAPTTKGTIPLYCGDDSTCVSNTDARTQASFSQVCNCGYNKVGQSYCNLFYGDAPYQSFLNSLQAWLSSGFVTKCNTDARFSDTCIQSYWSKEKFNELKYWLTYTSLYPKIQNADDCTLAVMFPDYYALYKGHGTGDSDDSSAAAIGLLFAFLFASLI